MKLAEVGVGQPGDDGYRPQELARLLRFELAARTMAPQDGCQCEKAQGPLDQNLCGRVHGLSL
jgi:hypothetical protein